MSGVFRLKAEDLYRTKLTYFTNCSRLNPAWLMIGAMMLWRRQ
jgi:hypothetical protein